MARKVLTYFEKLKDPRWQRKRLEVMQRANFRCENCDMVETGRHPEKGPLHVHHGWYERDVQPWEYPDEAYQCLCEDCHKEAERLRLALSKRIFRLLPSVLEETIMELDKGVIPWLG